MLQICYSNFARKNFLTAYFRRISEYLFREMFHLPILCTWMIMFISWHSIRASLRKWDDKRRLFIATVTDSPWYIDVTVRILMISHIIAFAVYDATSQRKMLLLFGPGNPDESEWWNHPPRRVVCHILFATITIGKLILWCLM